MDSFPWWNETQRRLMQDAKEFADKSLPEGEETLWTKKFPSRLFGEVARRGWFGVVIPREYGGLDVGATGASIVTEELSRICSGLSEAYAVSLFGGVEQLLGFGSDEQKRKWLPKISKGEVVGAVCITEPFVGSDAAGIQTTAKRQGNNFVLSGKKRFITNVGLADLYVVYAKTSDKPEDKTKYQHLTAFIVEKGMHGFSVEKINELAGWMALPNGFLDFDQVHVPAENCIGGEGSGWKVMMAGLNFERIVFSAGMLGPMREAIRNAVGYSERRIQFGKPTIELPINQAKIADMLAGLYTSRLLVYHAADLLDQRKDAMIEAANAKLFASETYERLISDAIQVMGGDGWTRFYPVEALLRDAKVNQIGAGTNQIMKLVIMRGGLKSLEKDLQMLHREMNKGLKVPTSTNAEPPRFEATEENLLKILADDYLVNPGLYMTSQDVKMRLDKVDEKKLNDLLNSLEAKDLCRIYRDRNGVISLAKASYEGLRKANTLTRYKWYPEWVDKDFIF